MGIITNDGRIKSMTNFFNVGKKEKRLKKRHRGICYTSTSNIDDCHGRL